MDESKVSSMGGIKSFKNMFKAAQEQGPYRTFEAKIQLLKLQHHFLPT